jgi:hypothetical protein
MSDRLVPLYLAARLPVTGCGYALITGYLLLLLFGIDEGCVVPWRG